MDKHNLIVKKWSDTENLGIHRPWDELELQGHGLVNKRGEHFVNPVASTDPTKYLPTKKYVYKIKYCSVG